MHQYQYMTFYVIDNQPLMSRSVANLIRKVLPTAKAIEVTDLSKLHEKMLTGGTPTAFVIDPTQGFLNRPPLQLGENLVNRLRNAYPTISIDTLIPSPELTSQLYELTTSADLCLHKTDPICLLEQHLRDKFAKNNHICSDNTLENKEIKLSRRARQILPLIDAGLSNVDIAEQLGINQHTLKVHLWRLYKKLNVSSRTQLLRLCRDLGLLH